jgi:hypothetical protein
MLFDSLRFYKNQANCMPKKQAKKKDEEPEPESKFDEEKGFGEPSGLGVEDKTEPSSGSLEAPAAKAKKPAKKKPVVKSDKKERTHVDLSSLTEIIIRPPAKVSVGVGKKGGFGEVSIKTAQGTTIALVGMARRRFIEAIHHRLKMGWKELSQAEDFEADINKEFGRSDGFRFGTMEGTAHVMYGSAKEKKPKEKKPVKKAPKKASGKKA